MPFLSKKYNRGFVALITVIVISLILILVSITLSQSAFLSRSVVSDSENKEKSISIADACADTARLKLITDHTYSGNESVPIGSESCFIRPVLTNTPSIGESTIEVKASIRDSVTNLRVVINTTTHLVLEWDEVATLP